MITLAKGHETISLALLTLIPIIFLYSLIYPALLLLLPLIIFLLTCHIFFFRDPSREIKENSKYILAPADGKVFEVIHSEGIIRIRMSLLDVHVNRWPISGIVTNIIKEEGRNWPLIPFLRKGTEQNSKQTIEIQNEQGNFRVIQIVGFLARRCTTYSKINDKIKQGDRLGMVYYGSEVDIEFPNGKFEILVNKNDRTTAGITVIAKIKE
jgi:phosphatidylserine decarboxylase